MAIPSAMAIASANQSVAIPSATVTYPVVTSATCGIKSALNIPTYMAIPSAIAITSAFHYDTSDLPSVTI